MKIALCLNAVFMPLYSLFDDSYTRSYLGFVGFFALLAMYILYYKIKQKKLQKETQNDLQAWLDYEKQYKQYMQAQLDSEYNNFKNELSAKYGELTRAIEIPFLSSITIPNTEKTVSIKESRDILVYQQGKMVVFGKDVYNFSDILSCTLVDKNKNSSPIAQVSRTKTNTGSLIGRAAVGALTFGVAGAMVGAVTASSETKSHSTTKYTPSYIVKVGLRSIERPIISFEFASNVKKADEVYALIQAIIAMK